MNLNEANACQLNCIVYLIVLYCCKYKDNYNKQMTISKAELNLPESQLLHIYLKIK